jgi:predicted RNase H-like HicB family nuclease
MIVIKVETQLQWQVRRTRSGSFVAVCEPLGLASEGTDQLDLWMNIQESINLVLNDLFKNGELQTFLQSKGWKTTSLPREHASGPYPFEVPIELIMQQAQRGPARAAR